MIRLRALALLTAISALGFGALAAPADAARKPTLTIVPGTVAPGGSVHVTMYNWPPGGITATTCGNAAKRGTQDCTLQGAQGESVGSDGSAVFDLPIVAPPAPCPCVVLVSTPTMDLVKTTPVRIDGVPTGPVVTAAATANTAEPTDPLVVTASVQKGGGGWAAAFGGPAHRTLVVSLHNRGSSTLKGLRIDSAVGRSRTSGERVAGQRVGPLRAGARRTVLVPVPISAPTWGKYTVFGHVYGGNEAVQFAATTSTEPWGLELLVPALLLVWAQVLRRRSRAERRAEAAAAADHAAGSNEEGDAGETNVTDPTLEPLHQSSPDVGDVDEPGFPSPPYARRDGLEPAPAAANGHLGTVPGSASPAPA